VKPLTTCLNCSAFLPEHTAPGRRPQYCGPDCRRDHRNDIAVLQREVERLERELDDASRMLKAGSNVTWAAGAVPTFRMKLARANVDLEALRIGVRL
jgi:hypothetical protein